MTPGEQSLPKTDLFETLGLARRKLLLSERQVYIELHPSNTGALAKLTKPPVLVAESVTATLEPDELRPEATRIEVEIKTSSLVVSSPHFSESEKAKIRQRVRDDLLECEKFPFIYFRSHEISAHTETNSVLVRGVLTLHGQSRDQFLRFKKIGPRTYEARIELRQTDFGLVPLSALMGGLRSENHLTVRCLIRMPS